MRVKQHRCLDLTLMKIGLEGNVNNDLGILIYSLRSYSDGLSLTTCTHRPCHIIRT